MHIAESRAHIHATPQALFALTQDSSRCRSWDPFTKALVYQDGAEAPAVGVRVAVRSWLGSRMLVEYVAFQPGQCAAIRMVADPGLLRSFAGSWRFLLQAGWHDRSTVSLYALGALGWLDGLLQRYFQFETRRRLIALKHRIEHA